MKRKQKRKSQQRGYETPRQKMTGMLARQFAGAEAALLVTLQHDIGNWWRTEDYYIDAVQGWILCMSLSSPSTGKPLKYVIDTDWEEGTGAPIHRAVIEQRADVQKMVQFWACGTIKVELLTLAHGFEPVAALLRGERSAAWER